MKKGMMASKKGDEKYYIIISLILGLLVMALVLYYIFHEYFTEDEMNWETCRQSIILRNTLPEKDAGVATISTKESLPLKCRTQVVDIDTKNLPEAQKIVADTIASAWYLVGEGKYKIFESDTWTDADNNVKSKCFIAARIHLKPESNLRIDLEDTLNMKMSEGKTYYDYLNPSDGPRAFTYFKQFHNGGFWAEQVDATGLGDWFVLDHKVTDKNIKSFYFPKYFYPSIGDLLVVYVQNSGSSGISPFIILVNTPDIKNLNSVWLKFGPSGIAIESKVCSSIETIPA